MTADPSLSDESQIEWEPEWAEGKLPNMFIDPERHPVGDIGFTCDDSMTIYDQTGKERLSHLDGGSTSH